jgi:hypothetical protein
MAIPGRSSQGILSLLKLIGFALDCGLRLIGTALYIAVSEKAGG